MRSFSAVDTKGQDVNGTVIFDDPINAFKVVDGGEEVWLIDDLEDVGISIDAKQLHHVLPYLQAWLEKASSGNA